MYIFRYKAHVVLVVLGVHEREESPERAQGRRLDRLPGRSSIFEHLLDNLRSHPLPGGRRGEARPLRSVDGEIAFTTLRPN